MLPKVKPSPAELAAIAHGINASARHFKMRRTQRVPSDDEHVERPAYQRPLIGKATGVRRVAFASMPVNPETDAA